MVSRSRRLATSASASVCSRSAQVPSNPGSTIPSPASASPGTIVVMLDSVRITRVRAAAR
jgi:hypothetical protein